MRPSTSCYYAERNTLKRSAEPVSAFEAIEYFTELVRLTVKEGNDLLSTYTNATPLRLQSMCSIVDLKPVVISISKGLKSSES